MSRASRDIAPLGLRMPTEIRDRIEEAARENGRSMNAEILSRLQASFEPAAGSLDGPISRELSLALAELRLSRAALAVRLLKFSEHLDPRWKSKYRAEVEEWRAAAERAALAVEPAFVSLATMRDEFMPTLAGDTARLMVGDPESSDVSIDRLPDPEMVHQAAGRVLRKCAPGSDTSADPEQSAAGAHPGAGRSATRKVSQR